MKKLPALALSLTLLLTACGQPAVQETPSPSPEPTPEATATPEPTPPSKVHTDWSKLTPYEPPKPVYTRRYAEFTDTLIPADDYGELIPFTGGCLSSTYYGFEYWTDHKPYPNSTYPYPFGGLVTRQGEVVVDPVFDAVLVKEEMDEHDCATGGGSVLLLRKLVSKDQEKDTKYRCALADPQGRWCTGFDYRYYDDEGETPFDKSFAGTIPMEKSGNRLVLVSLTTGEELFEVDYSPFLSELNSETDWYYYDFDFDREEGWCTVNLELYQRIDGKNVRADTPLLFDPNGNRVPLDATVQWVGRFSNGLALAQNASDQWGYINTAGEWVIPPQYDWAEPFEKGYAPVEVTEADQPGWKFIDSQGNDLISVIPSGYVERHGDYWYFTQDKKVIAIYDATTLESVISPLAQYHHRMRDYWEDRVEEGWISCILEDTEELMLVRGAEYHRFPANLGDIAGIQGDYVLFNYTLRNEHYELIDAYVTLAQLDGTILNQWKGARSGAFRNKGGENFIALSAYDEEDKATYYYYTLDGKLIYSTPNYREDYLGGGLISKETDDAFELTTLDGETIFYWPIYDAID